MTRCDNRAAALRGATLRVLRDITVMHESARTRAPDGLPDPPPPARPEPGKELNVKTELKLFAGLLASTLIMTAGVAEARQGVVRARGPNGAVTAAAGP